MGEHREPNGGTYEPAFGPEEHRIQSGQNAYRNQGVRPIVEEIRRLRRLNADPRKGNPQQVGNKSSDEQRP